MVVTGSYLPRDATTNTPFVEWRRGRIGAFAKPKRDGDGAGWHFRARRCGARLLRVHVTTGCRSRYVSTRGRGPASAAHHGLWREPRGRLPAGAVARDRTDGCARRRPWG